ncbi:hypothetical protein GW537_17735 (plasmid) [Piscirickettsia salmonis]|nr:hypothetical protein GW538_17350 [Piscirickettsia salmonis]QHS30881.1 hypothetical protein GW537_17735 [Piscirickettsia salmonis]
MANRENIPRSVVETVVKMLSCKTKFTGHDEYSCSNPDCKHTKTVRCEPWSAKHGVSRPR